eukprot:SAG25_NODE_345_length_9393_cov_4.870468_6_plen_117_part_00
MDKLVHDCIHSYVEVVVITVLLFLNNCHQAFDWLTASATVLMAMLTTEAVVRTRSHRVPLHRRDHAWRECAHAFHIHRHRHRHVLGLANVALPRRLQLQVQPQRAALIEGGACLRV